MASSLDDVHLNVVMHNERQEARDPDLGGPTPGTDRPPKVMCDRADGGMQHGSWLPGKDGQPCEGLGGCTGTYRRVER